MLLALLALVLSWSSPMDKTIPPGAVVVLDFIAAREAPHGYGTVYANKQALLAKPITAMSVDEVISAGPSWTKRFGSSACGRYQFMCATLKDLKAELRLTGRETFDAGLQDRLGFHLLKRRGWQSFADGKLSVEGFALNIAKEWASFPVLTNCQGAHRKLVRGQSFYAGDGLNKALVKPEAVEAMLRGVKAPAVSPAVSPPAPAPRVITPPPAPAVPVPAVAPQPAPAGFFSRLVARFRKA